MIAKVGNSGAFTEGSQVILVEDVCITFEICKVWLEIVSIEDLCALHILRTVINAVEWSIGEAEENWLATISKVKVE